MDEIFAKASSQAVTFAIRSGISLASGYAIKTVLKFLDRIPESQKQRITIRRNKIQSKVSILSTSIDLIRLAAARGNSVLESTVDLIDNLREEIDSFDDKITNIIATMDSANDKELVRQVDGMMSDLLDEINDAIPLINLSLITCGVNLSGSLPGHVSPGRLLQASHHISTSNEQTGSDVQVGPTFDLVLYSIFYNPSRLKYVKESTGLSSITWKEDFARCLGRIKSTNKFKYVLEIEEDFDDGRYHEESEPRVKKYPLTSIEKLFFSASGHLLKLESRNAPVLIIKVQTDKVVEWVACGEVEAKEFDDSDSEDEDDEPKSIKNSSLSLLEYMLRLCQLQEHEQKPLTELSDEKLLLYLRDEVSGTNAVVPKTKRQLDEDQQHSAKTNDAITMDSNINRLELLELSSK